MEYVAAEMYFFVVMLLKNINRLKINTARLMIAHGDL